MKPHYLLASLVSSVIIISTGCSHQPRKHIDNNSLNVTHNLRESCIVNDTDENTQRRLGISDKRKLTAECTDTNENSSILKYYYGNTKQTVNNKLAIYRGANIKDSTDGVTINFEGVELKQVIDAILGDMLDLNYTISPELTGKVNFTTNKPIAKKFLLPTLDMILAIHNAALIEKENMYIVVSADDDTAAQSTPYMWRGKHNLPAGTSTTLIPVKYIMAKSLKRILEPFKPKNTRIHIDSSRNLIFIMGTRNELASLVKIINIFDVDQFAGKSVALYMPEYIDSKTMVSELKTILNSETEDGLNKLASIIPIQRMNTILVVSAQPDYIRHIGEWIERLDATTEKFGEKLYVYNVHNGKASALAKVLNQIFTRSTATSSGIPLEPGSNPGTINTAPASGTTTGAPRPLIGALPGNTQAISQNIPRIIADDTSNTLLIYASPYHYKILKEAVSKLERQPLQVLIEASFLEVALNNNLQYGVQWFLKGRIGDYTQTAILGSGNSSTLTPSFPGFAYSIIDSADRVRGIIEALDSETNLNVISRPSLFVLNNHTASITVGDEVPVVTRSSVNTTTVDAPTINEIDYVKTGVLLTVTPRANRNGSVNIDIAQEVSSAIPTTTSGIDTPTIQKRKIVTTVNVNNGATVVLGGLIREDNNDTQSGIPFLNKLPVIGMFFGRQEKVSRRNELLVLITPHVIESEQEAEDISNELSQRMTLLEPMMLKRAPH